MLGLRSPSGLARMMEFPASPQRIKVAPRHSPTRLQHATTAASADAHPLLTPLPPPNSVRVRHNDSEGKGRGDGTSGASASSARASAASSAAADARWFSLLSSLSLFVAVVSMSAVGPLFLWLQTRGVPPVLACAWRNQSMMIFLLPGVAWEWWGARRKAADHNDDASSLLNPGKAHRSPTVARRESNAAEGGVELYSFPSSIDGDEGAVEAMLEPDSPSASPASPEPSAVVWDASTFFYLLLVSLTWAGSLVLWVVALPYTTTPRASLFCSTYPLALVPWMKYGQKVDVSRGEIIGVALAFLGILVSEADSLLQPDSTALTASIEASALDSSSSAAWTPAQNQLWGDMLCLGSSALLGLNILFAEKARRTVPLFAYTFSTALAVLAMLVLGSALIEGATWTVDPRIGLAGWIDPEWIGIILAFGFVVGCIGILGFNFAVKYVNPLIFSSTQLLDPGLTGVMSWCAGLEGLPSASTFLGISIVTVGIGFITVYQHRREAAEKELKEKKERAAAPDKRASDGTRSPGSQV